MEQRDKYDQLWQSTVLALESQRSHSEREMLAISTRLSFLADEVVFQRRMYQLNTLLLVVTICVVIFGRNDRLAMPLGRHLRTHSSMRIFESPPTSPQSATTNPAAPTAAAAAAAATRKKRSDSEGSIGSVGGPMISPPPSREHSPLVDMDSPSPSPSPSPSSSPSPSPSLQPQSQPQPQRRGWIHHFGPKLRVEDSGGGSGRGRAWQRLPSPLAGDGEAGEQRVYSEQAL